MKKKIIIVFIIAMVLFTAHSSVENDFLNNLFSPLNDVVDDFAEDYSVLGGVYNAGGEIRGAASIGSFPSFRVGATFGTILVTNPFGFLKQIDINDTGYSDLISSLGTVGDVLAWFDNYFLPMPIANYHFHIGLPAGLTVGMKFNIGPLGSIITAAAPMAEDFLHELLHWGVGGNLTYTILKEHKYYPTISVSGGVQYSQFTMAVGVPGITIAFDATNDIETSLSFESEYNNLSLYFDFSISKKFIFFQPFISFKFIQTVSHNLTAIGVAFDLSNASTDLKSTIQGIDSFELSNMTGKDDLTGNDIGVVYPFTDVVISTGFEFVMKIFRLGLEGSYGVVSKTGSITMGMRFQVESYQFDKLKKRMGN